MSRLLVLIGLLFLLFSVGSGCNKPDGELPKIESNSKRPTVKQMKAKAPDKAPPPRAN